MLVKVKKISTINKLISSSYVPRINSETNTSDILNTPVYDSSNTSIVLHYNNPRKINDKLALHFYQISKIPEKSYYKALGTVTIMNYEKTAYQILKDKINKDNIDLVLKEWNDFIDYKEKNNKNNLKGLVKKINNELYKIKERVELCSQINIKIII